MGWAPSSQFNFLMENLNEKSINLYGRMKCTLPRVTDKTKAWLSNDGNDDLCITDLYLDTVTQDGTPRFQSCRYDADLHYR